MNLALAILAVAVAGLVAVCGLLAVYLIRALERAERATEAAESYLSALRKAGLINSFDTCQRRRGAW